MYRNILLPSCETVPLTKQNSSNILFGLCFFMYILHLGHWFEDKIIIFFCCNPLSKHKCAVRKRVDTIFYKKKSFFVIYFNFIWLISKFKISSFASKMFTKNTVDETLLEFTEKSWKSMKMLMIKLINSNKVQKKKENSKKELKNFP